MGAEKDERLSRRVPAPAKAAGALAVAWGMLPDLYRRLGTALYDLASPHGRVHGQVGAAMRDVIQGSSFVFSFGLAPLVVGLTFALPLAMLVRMVARARIRAGLADPLDRAREWASAHPRAIRALTAVPATMWLSMALVALCFVRRWGGHFMYGHLVGSDGVVHAHHVYAPWMAGLTAVMATAALSLDKAARWGMRAFLGPTVSILEMAEVAPPTSERRVGFNAVAVTPEARATVAAMAALPIVTLFAMNAARLGDTATGVALAAYLTAAITGALAFRRASRVAIGVDGIFIAGSSRSRFFAYRDVEGVRARGSDIELQRKWRVVLRLRLHGEDATHKDAIVLRIQEAVDAARQRPTAAVADVAASASEERLARLADGGEGYRTASVTKEQLWSLVRAPEPEPGVRTAAARALVSRGDEDDRARLRAAARECAQPGVRVALMELAEDDDEGPVRTPRRSSGASSGVSFAQGLLQLHLFGVTMLPEALQLPSTQTACSSPPQMISQPGALSFAQTSAARLHDPAALAIAG